PNCLANSNRPTFALITLRSVIVMTVTPVAPVGALRSTLAPRPDLLSHRFQPSVRSRQDFYTECLFADPPSCEPTNVSHMIPRSRDNLWQRHAGLVRLSEGSMGIMGRTPDYMNMKFAGFASAPRVWAGADGRNEHGAANLVNFQRYLSQADISL